MKKMPTVSFDASLVSKAVESDVLAYLESLGDLDRDSVAEIYPTAMRSICSGRDLAMVCDVLLRVDGMKKGRAAEIARILHGRATALINVERQTRLGITHAVWKYAGAPCMVNPSNPTIEETQQDAAHRAADGVRFEICKGLLLDGRWTWPGREAGCKCLSKSSLPF